MKYTERKRKKKKKRSSSKLLTDLPLSSQETKGKVSGRLSPVGQQDVDHFSILLLHCYSQGGEPIHLQTVILYGSLVTNGRKTLHACSMLIYIHADCLVYYGWPTWLSLSSCALKGTALKPSRFIIQNMLPHDWTDCNWGHVIGVRWIQLTSSIWHGCASLALFYFLSSKNYQIIILCLLLPLAPQWFLIWYFYWSFSEWWHGPSMAVKGIIKSSWPTPSHNLQCVFADQHRPEAACPRCLLRSPEPQGTAEWSLFSDHTKSNIHVPRCLPCCPQWTCLPTMSALLSAVAR